MKKSLRTIVKQTTSKKNCRQKREKTQKSKEWNSHNEPEWPARRSAKTKKI
jgi:hypothetical protein